MNQNYSLFCCARTRVALAAGKNRATCSGAGSRELAHKINIFMNNVRQTLYLFKCKPILAYIRSKGTGWYVIIRYCINWQKKKEMLLTNVPTGTCGTTDHILAQVWAIDIQTHSRFSIRNSHSTHSTKTTWVFELVSLTVLFKI